MEWGGQLEESAVTLRKPPCVVNCSIPVTGVDKMWVLGGTGQKGARVQLQYALPAGSFSLKGQ